VWQQQPPRVQNPDAYKGPPDDPDVPEDQQFGHQPEDLNQERALFLTTEERHAHQRH
jgi:hypothetical protein